MIFMSYYCKEYRCKKKLDADHSYHLRGYKVKFYYLCDHIEYVSDFVSVFSVFFIFFGPFFRVRTIYLL